jgi:hypothetical protein
MAELIEQLIGSYQRSWDVRKGRCSALLEEMHRHNHFGKWYATLSESFPDSPHVCGEPSHVFAEQILHGGVEFGAENIEELGTC